MPIWKCQSQILWWSTVLEQMYGNLSFVGDRRLAVQPLRSPGTKRLGEVSNPSQHSKHLPRAMRSERVKGSLATAEYYSRYFPCVTVEE